MMFLIATNISVSLKIVRDTGDDLPEGRLSPMSRARHEVMPAGEFTYLQARVKVEFSDSVERPKPTFSSGLENIVHKLSTGNEVLGIDDMYLAIPVDIWERTLSRLELFGKYVQHGWDREGLMEFILAEAKKRLCKVRIEAGAGSELYALYYTPCGHNSILTLKEYEAMVKRFYNIDDNYSLILPEESENSPVHYWRNYLPDNEMGLFRVPTGDVFANVEKISLLLKERKASRMEKEREKVRASLKEATETMLNNDYLHELPYVRGEGQGSKFFAYYSLEKEFEEYKSVKGEFVEVSHPVVDFTLYVKKGMKGSIITIDKASLGDNVGLFIGKKGKNVKSFSQSVSEAVGRRVKIKLELEV